MRASRVLGISYANTGYISGDILWGYIASLLNNNPPASLYGMIPTCSGVIPSGCSVVTQTGFTDFTFANGSVLRFRNVHTSSTPFTCSELIGVGKDTPVSPLGVATTTDNLTGISLAFSEDALYIRVTDQSTTVALYAMTMPLDARHDGISTSNIAVMHHYSPGTIAQGVARAYPNSGSATPVNCSVLSTLFQGYGDSLGGVYDPVVSAIRRSLSTLTVQDLYGQNITNGSRIVQFPAVSASDDTFGDGASIWRYVGADFAGTSSIFMRD